MTKVLMMVRLVPWSRRAARGRARGSRMSGRHVVSHVCRCPLRVEPHVAVASCVLAGRVRGVSLYINYRIHKQKALQHTSDGHPMATKKVYEYVILQWSVRDLEAVYRRMARRRMVRPLRYAATSLQPQQSNLLLLEPS